MPVVMVIAIIAVLAVVVFVASGRGGEMSVERNDYVPLDLGPVTATDVALLRPPTGLWGYNMQLTDEAMQHVAEAIRERDVRIVALEQLVTDLSASHPPMPLLAGPHSGARHRRPPETTAEMEAIDVPAEAEQAEHDQLPFGPQRPATDAPGAAPEQSHD